MSLKEAADRIRELSRKKSDGRLGRDTENPPPEPLAPIEDEPAERKSE
jgi:hypothetical protein